MMVEEQSAVLYIPNEARIPLMGNHSTITKFEYRDSQYAAIRRELETIIEGVRLRLVDSNDSPTQRYDPNIHYCMRSRC